MKINERTVYMMKNPLITLALFTLFLCIPGSAFPQEDGPERIKALFDACDKPELPGGFAAALVKDGKVIFANAYGYANDEYRIPFTLSTVADYASVAKQFTGLAIAMLVDEGKISLTDDIRTYLPEVPDFGYTITINHLLHHTSGIRDWVGLVKISGRYEEDVITDDLLMRLVSHQRELNFRPGDQFQYSNNGYFLLAQIVSRVAHKSFREWMKEKIFIPLEMNDTHFNDNFREIIPNRADSYRDVDGVLENHPDNKEGYGSSSLYSTVNDMIKWVQNFQSKKVGNENVWRMMFSKGKLNNGKEINYGFGFTIRMDDDIPVYEHGGSWAGFLSQVTYYPDREVAYILISNRNPSGVYVDEALFNIVLEREEKEGSAEQQAGAKHAEVEIDRKILQNYVGLYKIDWPQFKNKAIRVDEVDGYLVIRMPWEDQFRVYPESETKFFYKNADIQFSFLQDDHGKTNRLVYHWKGSDNPPFWKLENDVSTYTEINDLYGDYYSDELHTIYGIKNKDGRLIAEHIQNGDIQLFQLDRDHYIASEWWFTALTVERDKEDKIVGIRVSGDSDNIRNLSFVKCEIRKCTSSK